MPKPESAVAARRFVIGPGRAYRALLEFVATCPCTEVLLMAICQRQPVVLATRASSATALLYPRAASAGPSPETAAEAEAATTL